MRYLITGGAGFIGSYLAEALLHRGDDVVVMDDLSTGSIENIRHLRPHPGFRYFLDTIANRQVLAELVDETDVILHMAAAVGVRLIINCPVRTIETNVHGTRAVLDAAGKKRKLVFIASTSEVYGKSNCIPFHEDADLVLGATSISRWSYAASKALDEFLSLAYWKEKKQPVVVARLFNTVGPRQTGRYGMVLPSFVGQALRGDPITVYGSGRQSRCFCDVRDTVESILRLIAEERAIGQVVNIGSDQEISMEDLARLVKQRSGSNSSIEYVPYDKAYEPGFEDMPRRVPSLDKLQSLIGYRPRTPLNEIVDRVITYSRNRDLSASRDSVSQSSRPAGSPPVA